MFIYVAKHEHMTIKVSYPNFRRIYRSNQGLKHSAGPSPTKKGKQCSMGITAGHSYTKTWQKLIVYFTARNGWSYTVPSHYAYGPTT